MSERVLVVTPLTFSYHVSICEALEKLGYAPTWWNDRANSSTLYKIALRLMPRLTTRLTESHFNRQIDALPENAFDHILIIKGEGMGERVIRKLRQRHPRASMGLYLWDSTENAKGVMRIAPLFDTVATFDPVDAAENGWNYRPLFARKAALGASQIQDASYDWCFIGTVHSDRHQVISRLRQTGGVQSRGYVFAYFQSPLMLVGRKLIDWTLWSAPAGTLSTVPMPASEVAEVVAQSRTVLDVEHPQQRGLTMRTIETLLTGKKLLSTNRHLLASDLYDPSRAQMIDRSAPKIDADFLKTPVTPVTEEIRARYTCEYWATELLKWQIEARQTLHRIRCPMHSKFNNFNVLHSDSSGTK